jgi:FlaA1/EpsC-like NDP-sugar epimerase
VAELSRLPLKLRTIPAISDLVDGKYQVGQLREIDIDDLLGRSAVPANPDLMREILADRVILVTGAGGSIGSELTRQIVQQAPSKLVLLEANEFALYEIDRQLRALANVPIVPILGSVADARLVRRTLGEQGVEVIFHAAAHKHVPLVEANPFEGVRNNVIGTQTLVQAAVEAKVQRFVLISTDKAVRPSSVMGATKRWAELIVRHYGKGRGKRFCSVRFGNVLGSNGSVVPLFREQIAAGGPVTLTDSRMTRYFMSIHEAAELIVQAGALAEGGDIFLLEMGEPVSISDLAENMIRLAGLSVKSADNPTGDIAIVETGARPGEKLTEELFFDPANALRTTQQKILRSPPSARQTNDLPAALAALTTALDAEDEAELRRVLFDYVKV